MEMFRQHKRQRKIAAAADKTGNGYLLEMFRYELANHEYGYTATLSLRLMRWALRSRKSPGISGCVPLI